MTTDEHEREHVTLGIYRRPDQFKVGNYEGTSDFSSLRWTVDTPEDLAFVEIIYQALYGINSTFEFDDILAFLNSSTNISRTSQDAPRNAALIGLNTGAMNVEKS